MQSLLNKAGKALRLTAWLLLLGLGEVSDARADQVVLTTLHVFSGMDGQNPDVGLTQANDGKLYGTTENGGTNGHGTVFRMTTNGIFESLYSFNPTSDGYAVSSQNGNLVQASDGRLYGTLYYGGSNNLGAIFRVTTNGAVTPLFSLKSTSPAGAKNPTGGLLQASDGKLYGPAGGGSSGYGDILSITTNGALSSFYSFLGRTNGDSPYGALVQAGDGKLYGMTLDGGRYGLGTIFWINSSGAFKVIYSFAGASDGCYPQGGLLLAKDGKLYGASHRYSDTTYGCIIQITTNGILNTLYSFRGANDGFAPFAGLMQASDGDLYGTTPYGGTYGNGTIFRISTNGAYASVYSFTGRGDGANPYGGLNQATDGCLYGTTRGLGVSNDVGTIFRFNPGLPRINLKPLSLRITNGATATFAITVASNSLPMSIYWKKKADIFENVLTDGGNISGSTTSNLTISGVSSADAADYTAVVSNIYGLAISSPATLLIKPDNDDFADRLPLVGLAQENNLNASIEPHEPNPGGFGSFNAANSLWWSWTAPTNGLATITASGINGSLLVAVYTGSTLSNLVCIASNLNAVLDDDLINAGVANRVSFTANAGVSYDIQLADTGYFYYEFFSVAVEPVALKVVSVTKDVANADGSTPFSATILIGNSGRTATGPVQLQLVARAGYSYNKPLSTPPYYTIDTPDDQSQYYYLGSLAPGQTTNILISGLCPGPTTTYLFPSDAPDTLGFGWGMFVVLNEEVGTNWFFHDNDFLFYGQWPVVADNVGPSAGVPRINPTVSGSVPVFKSASINGPAIVNQASTNAYSGTALFFNGSRNVPVNFTNTLWAASRFQITSNGLFLAGDVTTNTRVTLSAPFSYDYYGQTITNTSQLSVLVLRSSQPSLGNYGLQTNKNFGLTLNTLPTNKFEIEATTNLTAPIVWLPLATNFTDTNGNWTFTDTDATNRSRRYYRAVQSH